MKLVVVPTFVVGPKAVAVPKVEAGPSGAGRRPEAAVGSTRA